MNKSFTRLLATGVAVTVLSATAPMLTLAPAQAQALFFAQSSVGEAETMLRDALSKLEQAKAEGADPSAAEAEVAAAQAALDALRQAEADAGAKAAADAEAEAAAKAAADAEAAKQAEADAAAKAAADAEIAKQAEADAAAKAAADAEAAKQAEADAAAKAAADAEAAKQAEAEAAAKAAADAEAAKQAEAEAAAKAAADAEAAAKAEADAAAKAAEDAKAASDAEAQKAADDAAAATKAAADEAAAKEAEAKRIAEEEAAKAAAAAEALKAAEEAKQAQEAPAVDPAAPAAPADPVAPADPAAPAVDPAAPAAPTPPVDPAAPAVDPAAPTPPADPAAPAVDPATPADPAAPAVDPAAPAAPADPATPAVDPAAPVAPAAPADPAAPAVDPAAPVAPVDPAVAPQPDPVLEKLPEPLPENAAPVLDSAKEVIVVPEGQPAAPAPAVDPAAPPPPPPPVNDAQAIELIKPVQIESVKVEQGEILKALPPLVAPPAQEVVRVIDNRTIVTINNVLVINTPDTPRLTYNDDEVLVEQLPRGRTRETITRANGVQVVTIRNRFGDIIQRSRILPDGREVFLTYAPEYDREEYVEWRDPVLDLPPLVLNIPVREYILSVSLIDDREEEFDPEVIYYDFLEKPPVERVERTYSVREVKQSARVRDKVRRIDLDTLTFGFGSADIKEDQIEKLESVANAMLKLLEKNPGETFLIEGHTDAVGTDVANLNLSDKRAESVAEALTNAFGIPAENLTTQGYGERYLKVKTTKPSEPNRRVAIRRITQLVAPVALK
ncbi:MAG: OmpA family protein [Rhizobiaceae bacterium]